MSLKDSEVLSLITEEEQRQRETFTLIPSENYASAAVREALASSFTNKYSEGYPGARYYGGQEIVDQIEQLAQRRALDMFSLQTSQQRWNANVQPYSGSPANLAALLALAGPRGKILGLSLPHGGHLTHGHTVSATGILFEAHRYELDSGTQRLNMDTIAELAKKVRPDVIISGTTAYPRELDFEAFGRIADEVGAVHLADISHIAGLIVTGEHASPFPHASVVMSTTHKMLRGPRGAVLWSTDKYSQAIDKAVFPGLQGGPHENAIAAATVCFGEALSDEYREYVRAVVANARILAEALMERGFQLVTGGTDNHLMVIDLRHQGISGSDAEKRLQHAGIIVNKNTIPGDPRPPANPSGIRLGTPAITTRTLNPEHMVIIAEWISRILLHTNDADIARIRNEVTDLARQYPPPSAPMTTNATHEDSLRKTDSTTH